MREDPSNAAARNDLAIAFYNAAEMLDADGRTREALVSLERAVVIQDQLAAADPESTRARAETATNYAFAAGCWPSWESGPHRSPACIAPSTSVGR